MDAEMAGRVSSLSAVIPVYNSAGINGVLAALLSPEANVLARRRVLTRGTSLLAVARHSASSAGTDHDADAP
jgi:hypothetical protein